jgi:hypothetical protein
MLTENDEAVLTRDLPQFGLKRGDVGLSYSFMLPVVTPSNS